MNPFTGSGASNCLDGQHRGRRIDRLIFGWLVSPFSHVGQVDALALFTWLHFPEGYLPFVIAGAVTGGLAYYSADLLTGAR